MNTQILLFAQSAIAIFLVITILLQQRGTALGSAFGGGSGFYSTQRGIQKKLFIASIVLAVLFLGLSLVNFYFMSQGATF